MKSEKNKKYGFTIVELLIVIVVIGILAAITIVGYSGVQGRANDVVVKSDITQFAKKVREFNVINGRYPTGPNNTNGIEGLTTFKLSQGAYSTSVHNFYYCSGITDDKAAFAIAAVSKSGNQFAYYSNGGLQEYTGPWNSSGNICPGLNVNPYTFGYGHNSTGGWNSWTE